MFTALFGKKETLTSDQEQALELAHTTLMNRVAQVLERNAISHARFTELGNRHA